MKYHKAAFFIGPSKITAKAIVSQKPISFLGGVNSETGMFIDENHDLYGQSFAGKILIYPFGKGSTGDTLRIWRSVYNGVGPVPIINHTPDPIHVEGALLADIGLLFGFEEDPTKFLKTGDTLYIQDGLITVLD